MTVFNSLWTRDTNLSQVSSQQMLVVIYLPWKDGKLSKGRRKRSHKCSNLAEPEIELRTLWFQSRDLTNCANHANFTVREACARFPAGPTLGYLELLRRRFCFCSNICKWLDFRVFSYKYVKP